MMDEQHTRTAVCLLEVTPVNIDDAGIFCIKDRNSPGFCAKREWLTVASGKGMTLKIAVDAAGKQLGFIEYVPAEHAWRPLKAKRWMFIQCIGVFVTGARKQGIGGKLLEDCEADARKLGMHGICAMSSDGPWMANRNLFLKNGFDVAERLERYELLVKPFDLAAPPPRFIDWTKERAAYHGWHLIYADQCPWHAKSVRDITQAAHEHGIALAVRHLCTPKEAQRSPSGFGTFSLLRDGRLLADHYISRTRFENILRTEQRRRD